MLGKSDPTLAQIWRHPVKGIGAEALDGITLKAQAPLPGDRAWAVRHAQSEAHDNWQPRRNFLVVANGPTLAAVTAKTLANGHLHLSHPERTDLVFNPETEAEALMAWVQPLWPETQAAPTALVRAPSQGMADNGMAQVSIMNLSSLRALSQRAGVTLDPRRFRGNLWIEGLAPWEEFDLVGKTVSVGSVRFEVTERIERCRAPEANPDTGLRDADPCRALMQGWRHVDFGVYATILDSGPISVGDKVTLP